MCFGKIRLVLGFCFATLTLLNVSICSPHTGSSSQPSQQSRALYVDYLKMARHNQLAGSVDQQGDDICAANDLMSSFNRRKIHGDHLVSSYGSRKIDVHHLRFSHSRGDVEMLGRHRSLLPCL